MAKRRSYLLNVLRMVPTARSENLEGVWHVKALNGDILGSSPSAREAWQLAFFYLTAKEITHDQ